MAADKLRIYNDALRHLGEPRLVTLTDDVNARYVLDTAWDEAVEFVLRQGAWRFALKQVSLVPSAVPTATGYAHGALLPADWLRTHAIFRVVGDGRECPLDISDQGPAIAWNGTPPMIRYVSADYLNPAALPTWPEHFSQALAAYLAYLTAEAVTGERAASGRESQRFSSLMPEALRIDARAEDFWLPYQRSDEFLRAADEVISAGNWDFALKTLQFEPDDQSALPADPGWPYLFALPEDYLRLQAAYISYGGTECPFDLRETARGWSTDQNTFTVRYVSTDALDSTLWPQAVTRAVRAYLEWQGEDDEGESAQEKQTDAANFPKLLSVALNQYSIQEDPWLRFQMDGRYKQAVVLLLERGRWRFAVRTVSLVDSQTISETSITFITADDGTTVLTDDSGVPLTTDEGETTVTTDGDLDAFSDGSVSPGYTIRLPKPNDWLRTLRLYRSLGDGIFTQWYDVDFRDELGALHVNWSPCILRYVSRLGLDSTQWPANFRDAVLAWLEHIEARSDPKMVAVAKAKLELFQMASKEAQNLDDERDVPKMSQGGQFVRGRYGRGNFSRENAWPPF